MTGNDKAGLAYFLDMAGDYLCGGFRRPHEEYAFQDDIDQTIFPGNAVPRAEAPNKVPGDSLDSGTDSLKTIAAEVASCTRCGLCKTRTNTVPGEGIPAPLVMVIGEGPGADEDTTGRPFVGRAGQLLDRMLDSKGKIGLSRDTNCYIANIIKCRPPGNRSPQTDEISACVPFLVRQIKIIKPKIILALGNTAVKTLLDSSEGITRLRGIFTLFRGTLLMRTPGLQTQEEMDDEFNIPLLPTFHPSALLRDESLKVPVWEDLKILRTKLCELDGEYAAGVALL
ncbi:MAG: uracil-DNA glycosylase [Treponema sp.]|nr:uracil-DNA glycosylase [Treponema sp.]